ncbi:unnamed protein product [Acidithrix sp. C25]|nr:unnamed protein product [Acidithrix sp. C25]
MHFDLELGHGDIVLSASVNVVRTCDFELSKVTIVSGRIWSTIGS